VRNKPLISIITVIYNGEEYLEQTIQSVLGQTYENVEYIVIDGGSTDGTIDIIKKYEDKIDYWVSEQDEGIYDAMNKGIDVATGAWINFMNAGDTFYDCNTLGNVFEGNDFERVDVIYGDVRHICENYSFFKKSVSIKNVEYKNPFCHQSSFVSSQYHKKCKFSLNYKLIADYVFFYEAYKKKKNFKQVNMIISKFLRNGISNQHRIRYSTDKLIFWKQKKELNLWKILFVILTIVNIVVEKFLPRKAYEVAFSKKQ